MIGAVGDPLVYRSSKMQSLGTKMAAKAVEKSVKKELKSALPDVPKGPRTRSKKLS